MIAEPSEDVPGCGTYYLCPECLDIAYFSTREQIKRPIWAPWKKKRKVS